MGNNISTTGNTVSEQGQLVETIAPNNGQTVNIPKISRQYHIYCETEQKRKTVSSNTAPSVCPTDASHTVKATETTIIDTITDNIMGITISDNKPDNGSILCYDGINNIWRNTIVGGWIIQDIKSAGTNGGDITANVWTTRTLNTIMGDGNSVSLLSNRITFKYGTYMINCSAPACNVNMHRIRLYNVTDQVVAAYGTSEDSTTENSGKSISLGNISQLMTIITIPINTTKTFVIQHFVTGTGTSNNRLGTGTGIGSANEIFTQIQITKIR